MRTGEQELPESQDTNPMTRKKQDRESLDLTLQKSSAATFLTYVASTGAGVERFELRYEDENIVGQDGEPGAA